MRKLFAYIVWVSVVGWAFISCCGEGGGRRGGSRAGLKGWCRACSRCFEIVNDVVCTIYVFLYGYG